jgi:O-methyltransferase
MASGSPDEQPRIDYYSADRREFFRRAFIALEFNAIDGDYAEFGCHTGTTFSLAYGEYQKASRHLAGLPYKIKGRMFWALDSFSGLPAQKVSEDDHPCWIAGTLTTSLEEFHQICARNQIPRAAYETVEGYYDQTLARDAAARRLPENIALAYIDCDLYSSIKTVFEFLAPRLKHGMIIALDDYFVYSSTQVSGARRACVETFSANADFRLVPYFQYAWGGMSYIVESKRILDDRYVAPLSGFI